MYAAIYTEDSATKSSVVTEGQSTTNDSTAPTDEELSVKFYGSASNMAKGKFDFFRPVTASTRPLSDTGRQPIHAYYGTICHQTRKILAHS